MAFVLKLLEINVQLGVVASALSVRQIPPPAAAAHTRQLVVLQSGAMASAVTRPEVIYSVPVNVKIDGSTAVLGPIICHGLVVATRVVAEVVVAEVVAAVRSLMLLNAACAFKVAEKGMSVAGYARFAYSSSAAASGPRSSSGPGRVRLFPTNASRSLLNLPNVFSSAGDFPATSKLDGAVDTNAIAAAADISVTANAKRTCDRKRL